MAEVIGTALLVTSYSLNVGALGMGLSMIYMALVILLHPISGAHFNPALTLGMALAYGNVEYAFVLLVIMAQFIGGALGMTISMLFRAVGTTTVAPPFASDIPTFTQFIDPLTT